MRDRMVRLGSGILRRLRWKIASSPERCAENLIAYAERTFQRLGLFDVEIWIKLHYSRGNPVGYSVQRSFRDEPDKASPPGTPPEPPPIRRGTGEPRYPDDILRLLHVRLNRLLEYADIPFGQVHFLVKKGKIDKIAYTVDVRPKLDQLVTLVDLFGSAPPSKLWPLGDEIADEEAA